MRRIRALIEDMNENGVFTYARIAVSAVYRWYVTSIAAYGSVFGNLASIIVFMSYIYLSVFVFLASMQLDAAVRGSSGAR